MGVPVLTIAWLLSGVSLPSGALVDACAVAPASNDHGEQAEPGSATQATPPTVQPQPSAGLPSPADPTVSAAPTLPAPQSPAPISSVPVQPGPTPPAPTGPATAAGAGDDADAQDVIVVRARPRDVPGDPLQDVNARSFRTVQSVDRAVVGPVALAYKNKVPGPVRRGLRNFLYNLREPVVFVNFLIQLKPGKAIETVARFATNTTVGVAGLFDVARKKPFNLPRRRNGFANSLGFYGVGPGPFLFLPLIGPTTVRDLFGDGLDRLALPVAVGAPFNRLEYTVPAGLLTAIDNRAEFDEQLNELRATADPYAASRTYYLQRRQREIDHLRGRDRPVPVPASVPALPRPSVPDAAPDLPPPPAAVLSGTGDPAIVDPPATPDPDSR